MTLLPLSSAPGYSAPAQVAAITRLNLPVAPMAFCRMRHAPETKAHSAMTASEAIGEVGRLPNLTHVDLDGPGDPLASPAATLAAVALLKEKRPGLGIGVTSVGLHGADYAAELARAGVERITLLVETLDAATAEKLYAWIRPGKKTIPLREAAILLLDEQAKAVTALAAAGLEVTIRTTVYPGINAHQVPALAETMAELGATAMELIPFVPDQALTGAPAAATRLHLEQLSTLTSRFLPTTFDPIPVAACGCDCGPVCGTGSTCGCSAAPAMSVGLPKPSAARPRVAVASATGMAVDLHLGQAATLLIYGPREDGLTCLLETRKAPAPGSGETRWEQLADTLHDCFALLVASAGQKPREVLGDRGIRVILTEENIEGTVDVLYGGGKQNKCKK